jgi:hypothetical protein
MEPIAWMIATSDASHNFCREAGKSRNGVNCFHAEWPGTRIYFSSTPVSRRLQIGKCPEVEMIMRILELIVPY